MANEPTTCIYCGEIASPKGEGVHVVPAAFGKFEGEFKFRRICRKCNNLIGRAEESLIKCSHEAVLARLAQPALSRNRRGRSLSAAHGKPSPKFTVEMDGHRIEVRPSANNPRVVESEDQLVLFDKQGNQHFVPLRLQMRAELLRKKLGRLGLLDAPKKVLHASDETKVAYEMLMQQLWPNSKLDWKSTIPVGLNPATINIRTVVSKDYWRAIAKIGFHYYLYHSRRGRRGDEADFAAIREFILKGGDGDQFFKNVPTKFTSPYGTFADGSVRLPPRPLHLLAADETEGYATAMVTLFMGPDHSADVYRINLGQLNSRVVVPGARICHAYIYDEKPNQIGRAKKVSMIRIR